MNKNPIKLGGDNSYLRFGFGLQKFVNFVLGSCRIFGHLCRMSGSNHFET
jgi:hypothetical protein